MSRCVFTIAIKGSSTLSGWHRMCGVQSKAQLAVGTVPSQRSVESFTLRVSHKRAVIEGRDNPCNGEEGKETTNRIIQRLRGNNSAGTVEHRSILIKSKMLKFYYEITFHVLSLFLLFSFSSLSICAVCRRNTDLPLVRTEEGADFYFGISSHAALVWRRGGGKEGIGSFWKNA